MDQLEQHVAKKAATPTSARRIKLTASLGTVEVSSGRMRVSGPMRLRGYKCVYIFKASDPFKVLAIQLLLKLEATVVPACMHVISGVHSSSQNKSLYKDAPVTQNPLGN